MIKVILGALALGALFFIASVLIGFCRSPLGLPNE